jgi:hypothetical protein
MKHKVASKGVLWSVMALLVPVVTLLILLFGMSVHSALSVPLGYAALWMSPRHDVTRHVNFVLSRTEGPGREVPDKFLLLEILELDLRRGSQLRYDKTVLIKYAGYEMERTKTDWYGERTMGMAQTIIMGGLDASLVRAAFDHYRTDESSRDSLCSRYIMLKVSGAFYNPAGRAYCPDPPEWDDVT